MLYIGSKAARAAGFNIDRPRVDSDLIMTMDQFRAWARCIRRYIKSCVPVSDRNWVMRTDNCGVTLWEIEIAEPDSVAFALLERHLHTAESAWDDAAFATPAELLMLKLSHRYKKDSVHFLKTMRDIQMFRAAGVELDEGLQALLKQREAETYTYAHPSLEKRKADFFNGDGVVYTYDHDSIHRAVTMLERPAYTYFQKTEAEVACSREKFMAQPSLIRILSVLEETQVLALERSQVPYRGEVDPRWSFEKALEKVCTSITSGWWREFAWENYDTVLRLYDERYVDNFWAAVERGEVLPYTTQPGAPHQ